MRGIMWHMARSGQFIGKAALVLAATGALGFGVASCSSSEAPPPPVSTSASATVDGLPLKFDVTVTSEVSRDNTVGGNESDIYGIQVMEGRTTVNDYSVKTRLMYTMDFTDGEGPINGFLELVWNDGTVIGTRLVEGTATADDKGLTTSINANLVVIGGSDKAATVSGDGTVSGTKASNSSSSTAIDLRVDLNLAGAPNDIIGDTTATETSSASDSATATSSESTTATLAP